MKSYTYSEARQRLATLLDEASREGGVRIRRQDGATFVLQPVVMTRSPLDVPGVRSRLRRGELVSLIREEREAAGTRILEALGPQHAQPPKARPRARARPEKTSK